MLAIRHKVVIPTPDLSTWLSPKVRRTISQNIPLSSRAGVLVHMPLNIRSLFR